MSEPADWPLQSEGQEPGQEPDYQDDQEPPIDGVQEERDVGGQIVTWNIFVGDLSTKVTETELREAFSVCGQIHSVNVMRDKVTNLPLGYGFVHFRTKEAQQVALKPPYCAQEIMGQLCRVNPSDDKNTLFVGNLSGILKEDQVRAEIENLVGPTTHVELKTGPPPELESRGFAFVTFVDRQTAETAKRILSQKSIHGLPLNVKWAEVRREVTPETMATVTTLYIANIHKYVSVEMLKNYYLQWGNVTNSVIVKDPFGNSKGFGFITFEHRADCEQALNYSNNQSICGQPVTVTLAKPVSDSPARPKQGQSHSEPWTRGGHAATGAAGRRGGRIGGRGSLTTPSSPRGRGGAIRGGGANNYQIHSSGGYAHRGGFDASYQTGYNQTGGYPSVGGYSSATYTGYGQEQWGPYQPYNYGAFPAPYPAQGGYPPVPNYPNYQGAAPAGVAYPTQPTGYPAPGAAPWQGGNPW